MAAKKSKDALRQVLDNEGKVLKGVTVPEVSDEELLKIFDVMMMVRIVDDRMMRLQRQGQLGFYMKSLGEEASHFSVFPLRKTDWVLPSYREQGSWFWAGYTIDDFINQLFGNSEDPVKGRQMPVHHSANWLNYVSISSPVGTQIPQEEPSRGTTSDAGNRSTENHQGETLTGGEAPRGPWNGKRMP